MNEIYVELCVNVYHNDDAEDNPNNEPYTYQGSSSSSLESIRAFAGGYSKDSFSYSERVPVNFEPVPGHAVFIVTVPYSTGDTFQNSERIQAVAAFDDSNKAFDLLSLINKDNEENPRSFESISYDGLTIYLGDWKGYFEHLQNVDIQTVMLQA